MMKSRTLIRLLVCSCVALLLASCAKEKPPELALIQALKPTTQIKIDHIRYIALKETALGLGAQAGLAWRAQEIDKMLKNDTKKLNDVYNFRPLILNHNVLPPVLEESQNSFNLASPDTVRLASKIYKIVTPPRFVTAPPTWGDYLWMEYQKPAAPNSTLLPRGAGEREVWNEFIVDGWEQGVKQANEIFSTNLGRLTRDYKGMILYQKLIAQNMISAPFVGKTNLGITGGGNQLRIGDKIMRITAIPSLNANSKAWKAVIAKEPMPEKAFLIPRPIAARG